MMLRGGRSAKHGPAPEHNTEPLVHAGAVLVRSWSPDGHTLDPSIGSLQPFMS